jgi:hypothetical protein
MIPCEVEATFTQDGAPRPKSILWDNIPCPVESIGRAWTSDAGRHVLARVKDGRVFELAYDGVRWQGKVVSAPPNVI